MSPGVYRPKDENRLSDYVKRHLDDDLKSRGIIANREVQIRRGESEFQGQNTDIHVDAVGKDPDSEEYDRISVIIETKGCWHRDLKYSNGIPIEESLLGGQRLPLRFVFGWLVQLPTMGFK